MCARSVSDERQNEPASRAMVRVLFWGVLLLIGLCVSSNISDCPLLGLGRGPDWAENMKTMKTMKSRTDAWREPLLDNLLRSIRLRSSIYIRPEFRAPWAFSLGDSGTAFHIVASGKCWLEVKGVSEPVRLSAGDFVVMPRGDLHFMRDAPTTRAVNFFDLLNKHVPDKHGAFCAGGKGPITRLVCGGMEFENSATDPLLAVLPPFIHVKRSGRNAAPWLKAMVMHVLEELGSGRAGASAVVTRLADILFIQAVREYLDENVETAESGWLAALRDHQIGRALALLHDQPHQPWTVAMLAHNVALSRSAFAAKFTELVGEPPLHYLTRLRLNAASTRLRATNEKLTAIALGVGYESVAAFARAFKRNVGMTPGVYRHSGRTGALHNPKSQGS